MNKISVLAKLSKRATSDRSIDVVMSTDQVNDYGYRVRQDGWDLSRFESNPVVLYGHNAYGFEAKDSLPIGRAENVRVEDGALRASIRFASAEANPLAEQVFRLMSEDILSAVSVGFDPIDVQLEMKNGEEMPVVTKALLYELSVVPMGADPGAVREKQAAVNSTLRQLAAGRPAHGDLMPDEIQTPADPMKEERDALLAAAGVESTIKAVGVIELSRNAAGRVPELEAKIAELQSKLDEGKRVSLLASLRGDGKLTAHMERLASRFTLSQLEEFAKDAEPVAQLATPDVAEKAQSNAVIAKHNGKTWDEMSADELAALHKSNPELYAALRADSERTSGH